MSRWTETQRGKQTGNAVQRTAFHFPRWNLWVQTQKQIQSCIVVPLSNFWGNRTHHCIYVIPLYIVFCFQYPSSFLNHLYWRKLTIPVFSFHNRRFTATFIPYFYDFLCFSKFSCAAIQIWTQVTFPATFWGPLAILHVNRKMSRPDSLVSCDVLCTHRVSLAHQPGLPMCKRDTNECCAHSLLDMERTYSCATF